MLPGLAVKFESFIQPPWSGAGQSAVCEEDHGEDDEQGSYT